MGPVRPGTPSRAVPGRRPQSHRGARPPPSPRPWSDQGFSGFSSAIPPNSRGPLLASKLFHRSLPLKGAAGASARYHDDKAEESNFGDAGMLKGYEAMRQQLLDQAGRAEISEFFDSKGALDRQSPRNWALTAALGHPLSKSRHTEEKHGSLSTRQQLMNTQRSLENSRKLVEDQVKTTLDKQEALAAGTSDIQRIRHLRLLFAPLKTLSNEPVFKEHLNTIYMEDQPEQTPVSAPSLTERDNADSGTSNSFNKVQKAIKTSKFKMQSMALQSSEKSAADNSEAEMSSAEKTEGEKAQKRETGEKHKHRSTIIATTKGSGGAMTNEQRAMLLTVFKKSIVRVSSKDNRSALMKRSTWFRFLVQCDLIGTRESWDRSDPSQMRVTWMSAAKIFKVFAEEPGKANSDLPVLTFSGWANAAQAVLRSPGLFETQVEIVEALFQTFLPRIQEKLGISYEDAKKQMLMGESARNMMDRKKSVTSGAGGGNSNTPSRTTSRAASFFSGTGSVFMNDETGSETGFHDEGKSPLSWQMNLAEEQMCEPECLQLLHEYRRHLEALYAHYAALLPEHLGNKSPSGRAGLGGIDEFSRQVTPDEMNAYSFKRMLKELKFFPDFVQTFSLERHISMTQARHNNDTLSFSAFVECLCRIAFCYLIAYGNIAQQASHPKQKMLWMFSLIEARLPAELRPASMPDLDVEGEGGEHREDSDISIGAKQALSDLVPKGPDSLWSRRKHFMLSDCDNHEIILWPVMTDAPVDKKKRRTSSALNAEELDRLISEMSSEA